MKIIIKSVNGGWSVEVTTYKNQFLHFEVRSWKEIVPGINQRLAELGEGLPQ